MSEESALLREFLSSHDAPCPVCGYSLRGLTQQTCPECSAELRLGVTSGRTTIGPWMFSMVCLAMGLGFDAVCELLVTIMLCVSHYRGLRMTPAGAALVATAMGTFLLLGGACVGTGWQLVRSRARWSYKPVRSQWRYASLVFVATFVVHGAAGLWLIGRL